MRLIQLKTFLIEAGLASEFCLLSGVCIIILLSVFTPKAAFGLSFWVSVFALGFGFYFAATTPVEGSYLSFTFHSYGGYLKQFLCVSAAVALFGFIEWRQGRNDPPRPEAYLLLLFSCLGLELLVQAGGYWLLFLAAELFSICAFALSRPLAQGESGYKSVIHYFGVSALASGMGIFGLTWMLGFDGAGSEIPALTVFQNIGSLMFMGVLLFKLGAFPYHFWVPGVYTHAPTPWVGYISVAPKVAAAFALLYLVQRQEANLGIPLAILAALGITLGNLSALRSQKIRHLFASSAIAQAGILLVPAIIAYQIPDSEYQLLIFAVGYGIVHQGAFCVVQYFENSFGDDFRVSELAGKIITHPLAGISFIVMVLSIIGLPPTIGFTGKLLVFSTLLPAAGFWSSGLVIFIFGVLVFNTLLSLAYYYQIPYQLIFKENRTESGLSRGSLASLLWAIAAAFFAILAFAKPAFFFPHP